MKDKNDKRLLHLIGFVADRYNDTTATIMAITIMATTIILSMII
jgi:hypothetical protein